MEKLKFKVGDRVKVLPCWVPAFVGDENIIGKFATVIESEDDVPGIRMDGKTENEIVFVTDDEIELIH